MSIRIDIDDIIPIEAGDRMMKDATVYASTVKEALELDHSSFIMGSILYIVEEGKSYMLSEDGALGVWRSMTDGGVLTEGGSSHG